MRRWLYWFAALALFGCDSATEHGAHEVPVSKASSPEPDKAQGPSETGPTQKIPMH